MKQRCSLVNVDGGLIACVREWVSICRYWLSITLTHFLSPVREGITALGFNADDVWAINAGQRLPLHDDMVGLSNHRPLDQTNETFLPRSQALHRSLKDLTGPLEESIPKSVVHIVLRPSSCATTWFKVKGGEGAPKRVTLEVGCSTKVSEFKASLEKQGLSGGKVAPTMRLVCRGKNMESSALVGEYSGTLGDESAAQPLLVLSQTAEVALTKDTDIEVSLPNGRRISLGAAPTTPLLAVKVGLSAFGAFRNDAHSTFVVRKPRLDSTSFTGPSAPRSRTPSSYFARSRGPLYRRLPW